MLAIGRVRCRASASLVLLAKRLQLGLLPGRENGPNLMAAFLLVSRAGNDLLDLVLLLLGQVEGPKSAMEFAAMTMTRSVAGGWRRAIRWGSRRGIVRPSAGQGSGNEEGREKEERDLHK
jgi:hypothetical protein